MNERGTIEIAEFIDIGSRDYQQDCIASRISDDCTEAFATVCDGMGGLSGGEEVSKVAAYNLRKAYDNIGDMNIEEFYEGQITRLDRLVVSYAKQKNLGNAGTTMVSAIIRDGELHFASVGDSRLFVFHEGTVRSLVREHNYGLTLSERLRNGEITQSEYAAVSSRKKEALISFLGKGGNEVIDVCAKPIPLSDGDIVLLCSDGVTKILNELHISSIMNQFKGDLAECVLRIVENTKENGMRQRRKMDNISVILMKYFGGTIDVEQVPHRSDLENI